MVTGATYGKEHFFRKRDAIEVLCSNLLDIAIEFDWKLQAWAIFSNHYHFIAVSPQDPSSLSTLIQRLHGRSSRLLNQVENCQGRKVWHQYWETKLTFERSYLARLNYVMNNPVRHRLVHVAKDYPWCSAGWFEQNAPASFVKTVKAFPSERVKVEDLYDPLLPEK